MQMTLGMLSIVYSGIMSWRSAPYKRTNPGKGEGELTGDL